MHDRHPAADRISARQLALLFAAALVFHCLGNWSLPLIDRDEPRFAEASREMLARGDFVVPFFNGHERFDKPPLIYWLQCGAFRLLGENEFAARLPSAICAALVAVALAAWGARLFGATAGWRAAIIFSTCLQTIVHARAAVADMAMVLFVTLAAWAGWEWRHAASISGDARRQWKFCAAFGVALAFAFLAKGPIGLLPLGMLWWSGFPGVAAPRRYAAQWIAVAVIALGVVALWGIPALIRTHGEFAAIGLGKHVVERSIAPMEGHGGGGIWGYLASLPFFFITVWASFFPWAIWLPGT
ncbi:MAG TPA: glycosyltransferase family 39 protein, partial [Chthoniobacteraceae bacterium]|nr:glycosyltransferase family 39 protein [Chthoniobacteraceae bacterium]